MFFHRRYDTILRNYLNTVLICDRLPTHFTCPCYVTMSTHTDIKKLKELDGKFDEVEELVLMATFSEYSDNHITCRTLALTGEQYISRKTYDDAKSNFRCRYLHLRHCKNGRIDTEMQISRTRSGISIRGRFVISLWIAGHGASNRDAQERFQYSRETISRFEFI